MGVIDDVEKNESSNGYFIRYRSYQRKSTHLCITKHSLNMAKALMRFLRLFQAITNLNLMISIACQAAVY